MPSLTDSRHYPGDYPSQLPQTRPEPPAVLRDMAAAAGVRFNGDASWDIQVFDPAVYRHILARGSLGLGEAYMDGLWQAERLDELFHRLLGIDVEDKLVGLARLRLLGAGLRHRMFNLQSGRRAFQVGERHYDIGNDVFEAMLDSAMNYSCAYWQHAGDLEQAQRDKMELICRKLDLRPGQRLLEIGCGWGGLARHAATWHGVEVTGITVSRAQLELARARCRGLPVNIELMDYRELGGQFDKAVSVGMFEHAGPKNYPAYFDTVGRVLKDDGLFLLHTIGYHVRSRQSDPWIDRYIFPNGKLPAARELAAAVEGRFLIEDWHNFGQDYDRTLMAWWDNFQAAWPRLAVNYDERFYRMWKYYLHCCAGMFRARQGQLWQIVLSKRGRAGVYRSVREGGGAAIALLGIGYTLLAAGAMIFVVWREPIPETHRNGHQTPATPGLSARFAIMMLLDSTLGRGWLFETHKESNMAKSPSKSPGKSAAKPSAKAKAAAPAHPFLTDIKTLRERARKHIQDGAVIAAYRADRGTVIKLLNEALATELVCILRYKRHYFMASGINADAVAAEFLVHAGEEQGHADLIAARIVQLKGEPDFNPEGLAMRSHAEYVEGDSLVDMIREDLVAERVAIDSYGEMIQYIGDKDVTTRRMLEGILAMEEEHADDLSSMLEDFKAN